MNAEAHEVYQALGDPTRLQMIERLGVQGPLPTLELVEGLGMSRQAATKHLLILENVGLVVATPTGRQVIRRLDFEVLSEATGWLEQRRQVWVNRLDKLADFVQET